MIIVFSIHLQVPMCAIVKSIQTPNKICKGPWYHIPPSLFTYAVSSIAFSDFWMQECQEVLHEGQEQWWQEQVEQAWKLRPGSG